MKRLREFFETIAFAGMKPGARPGPPRTMKWLAPLRGPVDRLISGSAPKDPLYLSNRTIAQKIGYWSVIGIPCLAIVGFIALTLSKDFFEPPAAPPPKELPPEEVARKTLPNLAKDIRIEANKDVELVEVHVERSGQVALAGTVKNNTNHSIGRADVVFNLTNAAGSQLGAVTGRIENLPPLTAKEFQFPIKQRDAVFALVREVSTSR